MIDYDSTPARYRGTIEVYVGQQIVRPEGGWEIEWRWRCKSRNGQILGHGEGYRRKAGALNAIDAMFGNRLTVAAAVRLAGNDGHSMWVPDIVVPWRLQIVDRHHDTTTGAVY